MDRLDACLVHFHFLSREKLAYPEFGLPTNIPFSLWSVAVACTRRPMSNGMNSERDFTPERMGKKEGETRLPGNTKERPGKPERRCGNEVTKKLAPQRRREVDTKEDTFFKRRFRRGKGGRYGAGGICLLAPTKRPFGG